MRVLRVHVALSLVDVVVVAVGSLTLNSCLSKVLWFSYQIGCCFLIPFLTIKSNFRQLDNMAEYLLLVFCRRNVVNPC